MASTYTPQAAIDLVKNLVHGVPISTVAPTVCDQINSKMWVFYPWSWTLSNLTAISLVDGTQDYTPTDTDILRPTRLWIARTDTTPNEFREKELLGNLSKELTRKGGLDTIKAVGWLASQNLLRLDVAAGVSGNQTLELQGLYQKKPTKITIAEMNSVLSIPDYYFDVFQAGVLWKMYQLADDPRAGAIQIDKKGNAMYTGQLGVFMDSLIRMSRTEDLANGDEFEFPGEPLGVGRSYWPGLYGLQ